jgi:hypothetical protein
MSGSLRHGVVSSQRFFFFVLIVSPPSSLLFSGLPFPLFFFPRRDPSATDLWLLHPAAPFASQTAPTCGKPLQRMP